MVGDVHIACHMAPLLTFRFKENEYIIDPASEPCGKAEIHAFHYVFRYIGAFIYTWCGIIGY